MAIRPEEVRRIAALARLDVEEHEVDQLAADLSAVLEYARVLGRLELPAGGRLETAPADAALREDELDGRRLGAERALALAPAAEGGFVLVPPVVETLDL